VTAPGRGAAVADPVARDRIEPGRAGQEHALPEKLGRCPPMSSRWISVQVPHYREFLRHALDEAARRFGPGLDRLGAPLISISERSIGTRVRRDGRLLWLRVSPFDEGRMDHDAWTGNLAANEIVGLPKPVVEARITWTEPAPVPVRIGAELMTNIPDPPVAGGRELAEPFAAPDGWWSELRAALDRLAVHETERRFRWHTPERYATLLCAFYGERVALGPVPRWCTEHLDLHWNNVTAPRLWIIDWELWGTAVAGYAAATLHCTSLGVPQIAKRVRETFADVLDSPAGRYAQLVVIAELLSHTAVYGDRLGPVSEMHRLADRLIDQGIDD
jgi:hypothetical protein